MASEKQVQERPLDHIPDENTPGIFDPPAGIDAAEWRRHVEAAIQRKKANQLLKRLERLEEQTLKEWQVATGFLDVIPDDLRDEMMREEDDCFYYESFLCEGQEEAIEDSDSSDSNTEEMEPKPEIDEE
ncbi:hypothetical protein PT974_00124 [Cladobotryum mycophilum]|uniref:Uncharacterized protein n=1 Tax=Cladobotryum mycophilum TaxID=491253 RepID=A0ABR0T011_9HYPO